MVNIVKHFKELKSKVKNIKKFAKDCLANVKLLSFIPYNNIDNFYNLLKSKYRVTFKSFFSYFEKNYIKGRVFDKKIWNFSQVISNNLNNDLIFYTNNIVESFNSVLNKKFVGFCKTLYNYKNSLIDVISIYDMKSKYKEKKNINYTCIRALCKI